MHRPSAHVTLIMVVLHGGSRTASKAYCVPPLLGLEVRLQDIRAWHIRFWCCSSVFRKAGHNRDSRRIASPKSSDGVLTEGEDILTENGTSQVLKLASGQNTIDDKAFFEHLPTLLTQVSEKVTKLMHIEEESLVNLSTMEAVAPVPEEEPLPEDEKASSETAETGAPAEGDAPAGPGTDSTLAAGTDEGVAAAADGLANEKTGGKEAVSGGAVAGVEETAGSAEEESKKGSGGAEEGGATKEQAQADVVAAEATAQDAESKGAGAGGADGSAGGVSEAAASPAEELGLAAGRQADAGESSTAAADKHTGACCICLGCIGSRWHL
jgi:hypothetical protein